MVMMMMMQMTKPPNYCVLHTYLVPLSLACLALSRLLEQNRQNRTTSMRSAASVPMSRNSGLAHPNGPVDVPDMQRDDRGCSLLG